MYNILVPVDGTDHSLKALHIACDLAEKYRAIISLLYVLDINKTAHEILGLTIAGKFDSHLRSRLQEAQKEPLVNVSKTILSRVGKTILKIAAARAERRGIETRILAISEGDPAENILIAHKLIAASTIVMGSRGLAPSRVPVSGSISARVFAEADCTCISVK